MVGVCEFCDPLPIFEDTFAEYGWKPVFQGARSWRVPSADPRLSVLMGLPVPFARIVTMGGITQWQYSDSAWMGYALDKHQAWVDQHMQEYLELISSVEKRSREEKRQEGQEEGDKRRKEM